ncbi:MAG: hypothetical protein JKX83_05260 [Pseudomonadales bacterium]|nr:hypothetical protein [Pseudomonadales bacterium]
MFANGQDIGIDSGIILSTGRVASANAATAGANPNVAVIQRRISHEFNNAIAQLLLR